MDVKNWFFNLDIENDELETYQKWFSILILIVDVKWKLDINK